MPEQTPSNDILIAERKIKKIEERIEEVRIELQQDIGRVQASIMAFSEELSKLRTKCK